MYFQRNTHIYNLFSAFSFTNYMIALCSIGDNALENTVISIVIPANNNAKKYDWCAFRSSKHFNIQTDTVCPVGRDSLT